MDLCALTEHISKFLDWLRVKRKLSFYAMYSFSRCFHAKLLEVQVHIFRPKRPVAKGRKQLLFRLRSKYL